MNRLKRMEPFELRTALGDSRAGSGPNLCELPLFSNTIIIFDTFVCNVQLCVERKKYTYRHLRSRHTLLLHRHPHRTVNNNHSRVFETFNPPLHCRGSLSIASTLHGQKLCQTFPKFECLIEVELGSRQSDLTFSTDFIRHFFCSSTEQFQK